MTRATFPVLQTSRLILNQLTAKDRESVFAIFSDHKVVEHYDIDLFRTELEAVKLIRHFEALFESNTGIRWAVRDNQSKKLIGSCGFSNWNPFDHTAVISYELSKEHWGQGYATEMMDKMISYVFNDDFQFYVHRIEAYILPSNHASEKLAKKHHFQFEGTLREKSFWGNTFHDMNMFSLLRKDQN